jgi:hypothetical protein
MMREIPICAYADCINQSTYWRLSSSCIGGHVPYAGNCQGHPRCGQHANPVDAVAVFRLGRHSKIPVRISDSDDYDRDYQPQHAMVS